MSEKTTFEVTGIVSFPSLVKPQSSDATGKEAYKLDLIELESGDFKKLKVPSTGEELSIEDLLKRALSESKTDLNKNPNAWLKNRNFKSPVGDGDENFIKGTDEVRPGYSGKQFIRAKLNASTSKGAAQAPKIFENNKLVPSPSEDPVAYRKAAEKFYAGSIAKIRIELYAYMFKADGADVYGVNANIRAIKFVKDGEPLSRGTSSEDLSDWGSESSDDDIPF
jgi:Protein of unknown function (DUF2815)